MKIEKIFASHARISFFAQWNRSLFFKKLALLREGAVEVEERFSNGGHFYFGEPDSSGDLQARIQIYHPRAYSRIVFGGSIGGGESYMKADWDCDHLTTLIRIMARNREVNQNLDRGLGRLMAPLQKLFHALHSNSISQAEKNIHAHYDLGNGFFSLFLDSTFLYSAAFFKNDEVSLEEAQIEKIDRICRRLKLKPGDQVLEIGTGWGAFAIHAASKYGCKVTTATISQEQFEFAVARIKKARLDDQIEVVFKDYRLLEGVYDKIVSIEMIEAVGLEFLETYFKKCSSLLKPEGEMVIQAITIRDENYESAKRNVDFIQRYIFPGSGIPSIASMMTAVSKATDLQMAHLEDFGMHYAKTLKLWSARCHANQAKITQMFNPEFYRMWQFYLNYCEGGFRERSIGVSHLHFMKPKAGLKESL